MTILNGKKYKRKSVVSEHTALQLFLSLSAINAN